MNGRLLRSRRLLTVLMICFATCVAGASLVARTQKIKFSLGDKKISGALVLPGDEHPLNRLAEKLQNEIDGLKIIASDKVLQTASAKGAYSFGDHILIVSTKVLSEQILPTTVQHEVVHARIWTAIRRGHPSIFSGVAYNTSLDFRYRVYGEFFGLDEIVATLFSVSKYADDLRSANNVQESVDNLRDYTSRLRTMLTTLQIGLTDGKSKGAVSTPEILVRVPGGVVWQQFEASDVQLYLPLETRVDDLRLLLEFSAEAVSIIIDANELLAVRTTAEPSKQYLIQIDALVALFRTKFPGAAGFID